MFNFQDACRVMGLSAPADSSRLDNSVEGRSEAFRETVCRPEHGESIWSLAERSAAMTPGQLAVVQAAKRACKWFDSYVNGKALNGMHDDVLIGRALKEALELAEREQFEAELEARR